MLIRRYEPADCDGVWNLHSVVMKAIDGPDADVSWAEDLQDVAASFLQTGGDFLIGVLDDQIVAMGGIHKTSATAAEVGRMRVHPEYQRRGLGQAILQTLEANARELGFRRLTLETPAEQLAAQRLYVKHGFQEIRRGELHNMRMVFYTKDL
jgi:ribosomal protein S18 acetylase RimI-like enzyme